MRYLVSRLFKDESAATAIEYGLIAAGIALAIVAVVTGLGTQLNHVRQRFFRYQLGSFAPLVWPALPRFRLGRIDHFGKVVHGP